MDSCYYVLYLYMTWLTIVNAYDASVILLAASDEYH